MTEKLYGIYVDKWDLEVNRDGHLQNPDVLQIVEIEYDEETDQVIAIRRVDEKGNVLQEEWDGLQYVDDLTLTGPDDCATIDKALGWFEGWLDDNLEWRESYRGDYYNPPEYVCIGVTGCCGND